MEQLFDTLGNFFGTLKPDIRKRLKAVIDKPSDKTWDNAYSIIISMGRIHTLWQAVIAVDPNFPRIGPRSDDKGKRLERWAMIPDRETILKAILLVSKAKGAA